MAYSTTTELALQKAVPGSNQPFETAEINNNWDKVDAAVVAVKGSSVTPSTIVAIDGGTA